MEGDGHVNVHGSGGFKRPLPRWLTTAGGGALYCTPARHRPRRPTPSLPCNRRPRSEQVECLPPPGATEKDDGNHTR